MNATSIRTGNLVLYVEGGEVREQMRGGYMDNDTYRGVSDHTIIVCTDAVIIDRRRRTFFLARRVARPMRGLWWIGGRRNKGETPQEGMRRNFLREAGLELPPERFVFIDMVEYLWQDRKQEPQSCGSHNLAHQFVVELTGVERALAAVRLDPQEYDTQYGLREFDRRRMVEEQVHPVILDVYDTVFP